MQALGPKEYQRGVRLFNEGRYFECHDVLEELWRETFGEERLFDQGLIQAAVAMFHLENNNLGGAARMFEAACTKLGTYPPRYKGIDLRRLREDLDRCRAWLREMRSGPSGGPPTDRPAPSVRIHLHPTRGES